MDVRGEQLLASTGLARQQHARVRSCDLRGLDHGVPEGWTLSDHFRSIANQLPKSLILALQIGSLEGIVYHDQHAIAGERLLEKVERADSCGFDRIAAAPVKAPFS